MFSTKSLFCFRRQHSTGTTWHGAVPNPATPIATHHQRPHGSPDRLRGVQHDLFDLLERAQSSRLDDQRCVLPPKFNQVIIKPLQRTCVPCVRTTSYEITIRIRGFLLGDKIEKLLQSRSNISGCK